MACDQQSTMPRDDDRRRQTGFRVLFNRETERDAWYLARLILRLSPERRKTLTAQAARWLKRDEAARVILSQRQDDTTKQEQA